MAKLPDNFVKAPPETSRVTTNPSANTSAGKPDKPAGKEVRRKARRGAPPPPAQDAEAIAQATDHAHSVLVRLSPEEHQALSAACEALAAVGETVTIEGMIRSVVERWIAATRAAAAIDPAASTPAAAPRAITAIRAQLRWVAEQPVRRWRALRQALRRWTHALAG